MARCVILGAAPVSNYSRYKKFLKKDDFIIACDGGLLHTVPLEIEPDLIIGDFDSHEKPETSTEIIQLPCEKDDTDSFYAAKEAIKRGFTDFVLIGFCGARLDHTLVNISVLQYLHEQNAKAIIIDDYSIMQLVSDKPVLIDDEFSYFSLISLNGTAKGVNIENAKYNLKNGTISPSYQFATSNEPLEGKTAQVSLQEGLLLLIKVF